MKKIGRLAADVFIFSFIIIAGVALISLRESVSEGIKNGLAASGEILIPSLFPFMVLSSFAVDSGAFERISRFFSPVMKSLFRLPACCFSVLFFGFVGGYPVGTRLIATLYEKGEVSKDDAVHLVSFCVNAGPAFVVTAVGESMLGSRKAGFVMLISSSVASLLTGIVYARFREQVFEKVHRKTSENGISDALVGSVRSASSGILSICSWVLIFSAFTSVAGFFIENKTAMMIFSSVSEVTTGVSAAAELGGIPLAAACISFGGLSVMCQLLPVIKKCGVKAKTYLSFRILNSVLTFITTKIILCFTDVYTDVFGYGTVRLFSNNAPASAALLIMCALFIFDLCRSREASLSVVG